MGVFQRMIIGGSHLRGKTCMLVAALTCGSVALAADNLVFNPDMSEENGLGMPFGWKKNFRVAAECPLEMGPIGDGAFRIRCQGAGYACLIQENLGLVSNAAYRISYDVRSRPVKRRVRSRFILHDGAWSWNTPQFSPEIPADTKGEWVRQEGVLTAKAGTGRGGHMLDIMLVPGQDVGEADFDIRNLRLEAVEDAVAAKSAPAKYDTKRLRARIVPVEPKVTAVDPKTGTMKFYWPGRGEFSNSGATLVATLDGCKTVRAPIAASGYATVAFGAIKPGKHRLAVEAVGAAGEKLASDGYDIVAKPPFVAKNAGRKLNNLVTELVNAPLVDGTVEFPATKDEWVWISFGDVTDPTDAPRGYLDDRVEPVVRPREGDRRLETQRWLKEGLHRLRVVGARPGRTLRIHAVKRIFGMAPCEFSDKPCSFNGTYTYSLGFANRYDLISSVNTLTRARVNVLDGDHDDELGYYLERGLEPISSDGFDPRGSVARDFGKCLESLKSKSWRLGRHLNIDETTVEPDPVVGVNLSESLWTLFSENPARRVSLWYYDTAYGKYYATPALNVSEIAAIVNSGNGTGLLLPECYAPVKETRASLQTYIDSFAGFINAAETMVPAAKEHTVLYFAGYISLFDWSNYSCPETDIKVHFSELMRAAATDPRFAGCAGVAMSGGTTCDEEFRRWSIKAIRHYALEGATDDLAGSYGYVWTPGFVRNADFTEGAKHWEFRPAASNSLVVATERGFAGRVQHRVMPSPGQGDSFAVFTASEKGANEVRQHMTGLVPGKYYALTFALFDKAGDPNYPHWTSPKRHFSARLEGGEEYEPLRFVMQRGGRGWFPNCRYVFKANASEATLVLSDRSHKGELNEPGVRLQMNYVIFRPYYLEPGDGPDSVVSALGWDTRSRDANGLKGTLRRRMP